MNQFKKKPVTLIIADAGPLISLACADKMELLQSFNRPVLIPDVVRAECLRKRGAPGEAKLSEWFQISGSNQFKIVTTPVMPIFDQALKAEESGADARATNGFGDMTIAWLLKNLYRVKSKDEVALVLTQDSGFGDGPVLGDRSAHVLSTRSWLNTLERLGLIPSAAEIIDKIAASGRVVAKYNADRPALIQKNTQSDWVIETAKADETKKKIDDGSDGSGGGGGSAPPPP